MKEDATKDSYDIKRFQAVLNESYMMIPDSTKRSTNRRVSRNNSSKNK
jgi:hypothetical protein